jgi:hypothetical protein
MMNTAPKCVPIPDAIAPVAQITSQLSELDLRAVALLLGYTSEGGATAKLNAYRLLHLYVWNDVARVSVDDIVEEYHRRAGPTVGNV